MSRVRTPSPAPSCDGAARAAASAVHLDLLYQRRQRAPYKAQAVAPPRLPTRPPTARSPAIGGGRWADAATGARAAVCARGAAGGGLQSHGPARTGTRSLRLVRGLLAQLGRSNPGQTRPLLHLRKRPTTRARALMARTAAHPRSFERYMLRWVRVRLGNRGTNAVTGPRPVCPSLCSLASGAMKDEGQDRWTM